MQKLNASVLTIEDETGFSNLVVWGKTFDIYRKVILQSRLLMVVGKLQIEGKVLHVIVHSCHNMNQLLQLESMEQIKGTADKQAQKEQKLTRTMHNRSSKSVQTELFPSRDFK